MTDDNDEKPTNQKANSNAEKGSSSSNSPSDAQKKKE
jgi:hypothetical protein